jgi:hypothetical protein
VIAFYAFYHNRAWACCGFTKTEIIRKLRAFSTHDFYPRHTTFLSTTHYDTRLFTHDTLRHTTFYPTNKTFTFFDTIQADLFRRSGFSSSSAGYIDFPKSFPDPSMARFTSRLRRSGQGYSASTPSLLLRGKR